MSNVISRSWDKTRKGVKRAFSSGGAANPINWSVGGVSLHSIGDKIDQGIDSLTGELQADRKKAAAKELAAQQAAEEAQNIADQYTALEKARRKRTRMQGRTSTILAGGSSLGTNDLSVMRKTLLGG